MLLAASTIQRRASDDLSFPGALHQHIHHIFTSRNAILTHYTIIPILSYLPIFCLLVTLSTTVAACLLSHQAMVEDGRMGLTSATPAQLCLVSIAYHNLAVSTFHSPPASRRSLNIVSAQVLQLKMGVADLAAKSSQSARKIARCAIQSPCHAIADLSIALSSASGCVSLTVADTPMCCNTHTTRASTTSISASPAKPTG